MSYELRKIYGDKRILLLLICVILGNAILFYDHCTDNSSGYTMSQIQLKYLGYTEESLEEERDTLLKRQMESDSYEDDTLLTGDIYREYRLDQAVLKQMEETSTYQQYLEELIQESVIKLRLGILGDSDSFAARSLEKGVQEYTTLEGLVPVTGFFGNVELLVEWHGTDLLLLIFSITAGLYLLTYEKRIGLSKLTWPTPYGHAVLYLRKYAAAILLVSVGFLILYGTNGLIIAGLFGFENMGAPVQSVYGYQGCSQNISVAEFLYTIILFKYLWCVACTSLIFGICALFDMMVMVVPMMVAAGAVAYWMGTSHLWWIRCLSLSQLASVEELFRGAVYLNLCGYPIQRVLIVVIFSVSVILLSFWGGMVCFCRIPHITEWTPIQDFRKHLTGIHTVLFFYEWKKFFSLCHGMIVLLAFLAIQIMSYRNFYINNSAYEHYYRNYSEILEGEPTEDKEQYLESEKERFSQLHQQMEEYAEMYSGTALEVATREIQEMLLAEQPFEEAYLQYESLTDGQSYLYQSGYERLLNKEGRQNDLLNMAKFLLSVVLVFSAVYALEAETGVRTLQITAGKEKAILGRKIVISAIYLLIAETIAFLPQYIAVFQGYGGLDLSAQANSIQILGALSSTWSVGAYFAFTALKRFLIGGMAGVLTGFISEKIGNAVVSILISLAIVFLYIMVAALTL